MTVTPLELTEAMIEEGMGRAENVACDPFKAPCFAFPDPLEDARKTCTPKGRCKIGWIVSQGGRDSWNIWLEVSTGLVKLIPQADAQACYPTPRL